MDRHRSRAEADRRRDEHEEEHGDRGDRHRTPVASEHDQQARCDGDPRRGVGDRRQADDEPPQPRHAGGHQRGTEGEQAADREPTAGGPHRRAGRAEVDVAAVADDRGDGVDGCHDHPARPPGTTAPHPHGQDQRQSGDRRGDHLQIVRGQRPTSWQRPTPWRSVLPVLHNQPPHIIVADARDRRTPSWVVPNIGHMWVRSEREA